MLGPAPAASRRTTPSWLRADPADSLGFRGVLHTERLLAKRHGILASTYLFVQIQIMFLAGWPRCVCLAFASKALQITNKQKIPTIYLSDKRASRWLQHSTLLGGPCLSSQCRGHTAILLLLFIPLHNQSTAAVPAADPVCLTNADLPLLPICKCFKICFINRRAF